MVRPAQQDTETLNFLRRRVAGFGLFSGGFVLVFWGFRIVANDLGDEQRSLADLYSNNSLAHLFTGLLLLAVFPALKLFPNSRIYIRTVEFVALTGASILLIALGVSTDNVLMRRPDQSMLLGLTFLTLSRAVYVPSSGKRTALMNVGIGGLLLCAVYFIYASLDIRDVAKHFPNLTETILKTLTIDLVTVTAVWWTLLSGLAFAASQVIYGLRRQTRAIRQLGQYRLHHKIGAGGMGVVYEAHHAMLRRPTAVKLLPQDKMGEAAIGRFEREVKLTAQLSHPNTVTIHDYGRTPEGVFYYAMELLKGATLEQIVEVAGPMRPSRVQHVLTQVAGALVEAHELGLIHRDIKPANIMLCDQGGKMDVAKVLDFGLVKHIPSAKGLAPVEPGITQRDTITGTPLYMAPEATIRPDEVDGRSDLYALGAVAYFLLTGSHVFGGSSILEICSQHLYQQPEAPSVRLGRELPGSLELLVLRCLAKAPSDRPASARVFLSELVQCDLLQWTDDDADAWWRENTPNLAPKIVQKASSSQTILMDLGDRS